VKLWIPKGVRCSKKGITTMPNTAKDCPKKPTIDKEVREAKGHIDKVLMDPALAPNLKNELDLAKKNLDTIAMDNHK
jgi:hypothetical protein